MPTITIANLKSQTGVGFGTSGIRDLNEKLTDDVVYFYTLAFLTHAKNMGNFATHQQVALAGDLRPSTPRLMIAAARAITDFGLTYINCGQIPTPAVTYYAMQHQMPSVMVTGSHIPSDRNGIKYSLIEGEVLKPDEEAISSLSLEYHQKPSDSTAPSLSIQPPASAAYDLYIDRYLAFFGPNLLSGKKIGLFGHSAVGRDLMVDLFGRMGAQVFKIDFSPEGDFVPVDTDSVNEELNAKMHSWEKEYSLDHIISTDGDGDRPLLTDEDGNFIRPENLPLLAARYLGIQALATTISSSTAVDLSGFFQKVVKTKIGSPYVIAAMAELKKEGYSKVAAYELNGGFLLETDLEKEGRLLPKLPTRDALLPILSVLALAQETGKSVSSLVSELPRRFTYSSSIKGIPTQKSLSLLENWPALLPDIENSFGPVIDTNHLDGLRLTFQNGDIVHFRPSQNSPEFRNYTDSASYEAAKALSEKAIILIQKWTS